MATNESSLTLTEAVTAMQGLIAGGGLALWMVLLERSGQETDEVQRARGDMKSVVNANNGLRSGNYQPVINLLNSMIAIESKPDYPQALKEAAPHTLTELRDKFLEAQKAQIISGGEPVELPELDLETAVAHCQELLSSFRQFCERLEQIEKTTTGYGIEAANVTNELNKGNYRPAIDFLSTLIDGSEIFQFLELEQIVHNRFWTLIELRETLIQAQAAKNATS